MTIQEAKDKAAQEIGHVDWDTFYRSNDSEYLLYKTNYRAMEILEKERIVDEVRKHIDEDEGYVPENMIFGMLMRPCSMTEEDNEAVMQSSDLSVKKDFMSAYRNHIAGMEIVGECAKIYILKNYEKVKDWTDLHVVIEDNSKKPTEYYNWKEMSPSTGRGSKIFDEIMRKGNERRKKRHNPIVTLTDCVLDTTDGDFSLKINGRDHLWISDDSVVIIADFIEQELKKQNLPF
jgi:hypothetical protein